MVSGGEQQEVREFKYTGSKVASGGANVELTKIITKNTEFSVMYLILKGRCIEA